jgi:trk system potassium uptake protein TrkA
MNVIMIGGGRAVYFLCRTFLSKGHTVTIINRDPEGCAWLARHLKATVIHGEGSDLQVLEEAGAYTAEAVLAITPNDHDNLVICQLAAYRFKVPRTLALVNDPDNEEVFRKLGITGAISTTRIFSSLIEQRTGLEDIVNLLPVGEGKVNVTEVAVKGDSPAVGKMLKDIPLPDNSLIAAILRGDRPIIPRGGTVLDSNDRLIVMTLPENHAQALNLLTGQTK